LDNPLERDQDLGNGNTVWLFVKEKPGELDHNNDDDFNPFVGFFFLLGCLTFSSSWMRASV